MYSLFIGRWQPFHEGHKALIDSVLAEGKPVVIAIRDTPISEDNPYSVEERTEMIKKVYGDKVGICVIPDIAEIVYGRKVGYGIRMLTLNEKIEGVSGTKIRDSKKRVIWFTGNTGGGKTTLAYTLKERLNGIVLDGDEMRASISLGLGFSQEDREENNLRTARLAQVLNAQGYNVIVSMIAPFEATRKKIAEICNPYWIYVKSNVNDPNKPYEIPTNPDVTIDQTVDSLMESLEKIVKEVGGLK